MELATGAEFVQSTVYMSLHCAHAEMGAAATDYTAAVLEACCWLGAVLNQEEAPAVLLRSSKWRHRQYAR